MHTFLQKLIKMSVNKIKQKGQVVLKRSPGVCLKLTYRYLLKADHVPGDTWGGAFFAQWGIIWTNLVEIH